jgi:asparagine synthase (glutamine-hydrolysing)
MCGFFAVFHRSRQIDPDSLAAATNTLIHRGPDAGRTRIVPATAKSHRVHAGFGHRRLSIIDLNPRSEQPFGDQNHTLVYNGEIYDFAVARDRLVEKGERFETTGDTEVLHRLLARSDDAGLSSLNGMWAFCFHDAEAGTVLASRDRYGKKPLFYYIDAETICFASEAKAIFAYRGAMSPLSRDAIGRFLATGYSYPEADGSTVFEGVHQIRAGCTGRVDLRNWSINEQPWFNFSAQARSAAADPLKDRIEAAVMSRLISDRPVGLLLSGGVDSSLILSVMAANKVQASVRCFIGETGGSPDATLAQACADVVGVNPTVVHTDYGAAALDRIKRMCWHHEKPFQLTGNSVAMFEMYEAISREEIPVVLDGTGGDEVFGGYWDRYFSAAVREAVRKGDGPWLDAHETARRTHPFLPSASWPEPPGQGNMQLDDCIVPFADSRLREAAQTAAHWIPSERLIDTLVEDAFRGRLAEWIWHNDRNAMAFGIENRSPFLDWRLISQMGEPYDQAFRDGWNKFALRCVFDEFVPLPTQWRRQKQGFRWRSAPFIKANRVEILALVASSTLLREFVDLDAWLNRATIDRGFLTGPLTPRLIVAAAMEATFAAA